MRVNQWIKQREGDRNRFLWYGMAGYLIFLFLVVMIRAAITGITFDEAYTYLHFGQIDLLDLRKVAKLFARKDSLANNHWLNSILINLTVNATGVEYSEFLIRLPSLIFLAMYLTGVVWGYRRKYYSLPTLVFLVSNYYLLEFYGLARGYGMAHTFVFFSCCFFCEWKRSDYLEHRYVNRLMILMSLATFSNTIVLLIYPAFGLVCLLRLIQHKQFGSFFRKNLLEILIFILFTMLMVFYGVRVIRPFPV